LALTGVSACGATGIRPTTDIETIELAPRTLFELAGVDSVNGCKTAGKDDVGKLTESENATELMCMIGSFEKTVKNHADRRRIRNAIVDQLLLASNVNCNFYFDRLRGFEIGSDFTIGGLDTLVNAGGVAANSLGTAQWFSGASTVFSALDNSLDKAAFQNNTILVIKSQIRRDRDSLSSELTASRNLDYESWPLAQAISDAFDYNNACTVTSGLQGLERAAANAKADISRTRDAAVSNARSLITALTAIDPVANPDLEIPDAMLERLPKGAFSSLRVEAGETVTAGDLLRLFTTDLDIAVGKTAG
jgi:hypothetical protein